MSIIALDQMKHHNKEHGYPHDLCRIYTNGPNPSLKCTKEKGIYEPKNNRDSKQRPISGGRPNRHDVNGGPNTQGLRCDMPREHPFNQKGQEGNPEVEHPADKEFLPMIGDAPQEPRLDSHAAQHTKHLSRWLGGPLSCVKCLRAFQNSETVTGGQFRSPKLLLNSEI